MAMSFVKFMMLNENRVDFVKGQYKGKLSFDHDGDWRAHLSDKFDDADDVAGEKLTNKAIDHTIDHIAEHGDPTPKKLYTGWITNQYKKQNIRMEDMPSTKETLTNFDRHKRNLDKKDINQYDHIADVDTALDPHLGKAASKGEEERAIKHEGAETIHNKDGLSVTKLKTKEAACFYGAGTRWCTAAKNGNLFDHYTRQGPLYVVNTPDKTKYQFHFESGQYADVQDRTQPLGDLVHKYPGLRDVKEFKNKDPHFDSDEEFKGKARAGQMYNAGSTRERSPVTIDAEVEHPRLSTGDIDSFVKNCTSGDIKGIDVHPHSSGKALMTVFDKVDHAGGTNTGIIGNIIRHPNFPPSAIDTILAKPKNSRETLGHIASSKAATAAHLDNVYGKAMTADGSNGVHLDALIKLASNPNKSHDLARKLIGSGNHEVARHVLSTHPFDPTDARALAEHKVHQPHLARNPNTPKYILEGWAKGAEGGGYLGAVLKDSATTTLKSLGKAKK